MFDLRAGKETDAAIALRLEVLFHDEMIVRNSLLDGEWGEEEREENRKVFTLSNPLVPGKFDCSGFKYMSSDIKLILQNIYITV